MPPIRPGHRYYPRRQPAPQSRRIADGNFVVVERFTAMAVWMADAVLANDRRRNRGGLLVYFGEMPGACRMTSAIGLRMGRLSKHFVLLGVSIANANRIRAKKSLSLS
jgi:hypothetical protein